VSSIKLLTIYKEKRDAMKIKSNVKAGGMNLQHNEKLAKGLPIKTGVKAGGISMQHNEKLADDNSRSIEQKKSLGKNCA
jgi:hypothetical protein